MQLLQKKYKCVCFVGLSTALVERDDFSAGTSSRSTKLIHGGVRYLQKAIMQLDREQVKIIIIIVRYKISFLMFFLSVFGV